MVAIWLIGAALAGDVRREVATALATGECATALTLARGWVVERPTDAAGHKAVGDAQRCLGEAWEAVAAYRRAQVLGGDPAIPKLVEALAKDLGRIDLSVVGGPAAAELIVGDTRLPPDAGDGELRSWTALPVGVPLEVRVDGVAPVAVPALTAGEVRAIGVNVPEAPPGTVILPGWDTPGLQVQILQDGQAAGVMAEASTAQAGAVVVRVQGRYGAVEESLVLTPGERRTVAVADLIPGQLTLSGVPAGSDVRVEGASPTPDPTNVDAPASFDATYGVAASAPRRYAGLRAGVWRVVVTHPALGEVAVDTAIVGNEASAVEIDTASFPRAAALAAAYAAWQRAESDRPHVSGRAVAAGAGFLAAGAGATVASIVFLDRAGGLAASRDAYDAAAADNDVEAARALYADIGSGQRAVRLPAAGMVGGALAAVGAAGLSVGWQVSFGRAHRGAGWDPEAAIGLAGDAAGDPGGHR